MYVEISGSRCVSCDKYTQYYAQKASHQALCAIDCGFCGQLQRTTRPGNRCRHYREMSNTGLFFPMEREGRGQIECQ